MSTKIYNGFRIATPSIREVLKIVNRFRPYVNTQAEKLYEQFVSFCDPEKLKEKQTAPCILWMDMRHETKKSGRWDPLTDTEFTLVFFPRSRDMLGMYYCTHQAWSEEWMNQPEVSDFHYQNQTDYPNEFTQAQWDARGRAWDKVLGNAPGHIPSMNGFSIEVMDPFGPDFVKLDRKRKEERDRNSNTVNQTV